MDANELVKWLNTQIEAVKALRNMGEMNGQVAAGKIAAYKSTIKQIRSMTE